MAGAEAAVEPERPAAETTKRDDAVTAGRGFLVITGAKIWFLVGGLALSFGLPNLLPVGEFGQYTDINNNLGFLSMVMVTGVTQVVSRFVAAQPGGVRGVVTQSLRLFGLLAGLIALGVFLGAPYIAEYRGNAGQTLAYRCVALIILAYGLYAVFIGALNGQKAFFRQALFDGTYTTLRTALMLGGALLLGHSAAGVFEGFAAAALAILLLSFWRVYPSFGPGERARGLAVFTAQVLLTQVIFQAVFRQDVWFLQPAATENLLAAGLDATAAAQASHDIVAYYGVATSIARVPWQATLAITFVIFPMLSESTFAEDAQRTRTYIQQTVRYSLLLIGLLATVLTAVRGPLVDAFFKVEYAPAVAGLVWLAPAYGAFAIFNILQTMLTAAGKASTALVINLLTAGVAFGAYQVLLPGDADPWHLVTRTGVATTIAFLFGLAASTAALWRGYGRPFPVGTVVRVLGIGAAIIVAFGFLPLPRELFPDGASMARLLRLGYVVAASGLALVAFVVGIVLTRELGPEDKARFARVLGRKKAK